MLWYAASVTRNNRPVAIRRCRRGMAPEPFGTGDGLVCLSLVKDMRLGRRQGAKLPRFSKNKKAYWYDRNGHDAIRSAGILACRREQWRKAPLLLSFPKKCRTSRDHLTTAGRDACATKLYIASAFNFANQGCPLSAALKLQIMPSIIFDSGNGGS